MNDASPEPAATAEIPPGAVIQCSEQLWRDNFDWQASDSYLWWSKARELAACADLLWDEFQRFRAPYEGLREHGDEYTPTIHATLEKAMALEGGLQLLCGLALENALKGRLAIRGRIQIEPNGDYAKVAFGARGDVKGHDLVALSSEAGLKWSPEDKEFTQGLADAVEWCGKYARPLGSRKYLPRIPGSDWRAGAGRSFSSSDRDVWSRLLNEAMAPLAADSNAAPRSGAD